MKSESEIIATMKALDEGIRVDEQTNKKQDAVDKAIYLSALRWVMDIAPPSPQETKVTPSINTTS